MKSFISNTKMTFAQWTVQELLAVTVKHTVMNVLQGQKE